MNGKDSMQAFAKLIHEVDGERRIIADPPLIVPIEDLLPEGRERDEIEGEIRGLIRSYRRTLETDRRHLMEDFHYVDRVVLSTVIERGTPHHGVAFRARIPDR